MVATRTGLDAQTGFKKETTWGTAVTVDKFAEFRSESIKRQIDRIASGGLRPGKLNRNRSGFYSSHKKGAAGSLELEIMNKGSGFWLEHMLGKVTTSQPDAGGNPTVYDHTGAFDSLAGKGFTFQVGRPNTIDGTVHPFTYEGGKVASWSVKAALGEMGILTLECDFEDETTATALATASYPAGLVPFTFVEGSLTVAGSDFKIMSAEIQGNNNLKTDRHFVGAAKREPLEQGRTYQGTLEAELESLTAYNRFVNATEAAVVLLFEGATISGIYKTQFKVTLPAVRFDGETPSVSGPEEVKQPLPIVALDDAIEILYRTTDATV